MLVGGPRQVGKTTLARRLLQEVGQGTYFNWDAITDQRRLVTDPYFFEGVDRDPARPSLVVLDEVHKYARWKNWLNPVGSKIRGLPEDDGSFRPHALGGLSGPLARQPAVNARLAPAPATGYNAH